MATSTYFTVYMRNIEVEIGTGNKHCQGKMLRYAMPVIRVVIFLSHTFYQRGRLNKRQRTPSVLLHTFRNEIGMIIALFIFSGRLRESLAGERDK